MRSILAAALLATAATPAFAQDTGRPAFSGGHIEAIGGVDSASWFGESDTGVMYGIAGGYDFRSGNAVFGIEAEATEATTDECLMGCIDAGRDLYIGGRAGVVAGRSVLIYGKVGYTNARAVFSAGIVAPAINFDGIRAGAGIEWAIPGSALALRAEYRYSNYEDGASRNQGVVGLGLRF
jgi:outer membrane immunogenic protein